MWARLIGIRYLDSRVLFALAMALSVLPLWIPDFLPFVDIAQHAAQVASLRELASGNELFRDTFLVNWFTPYLGGYLVIFLVTTALPVVTAIKLVTSATVVALPVVTGLLLREIGADSRLKWLAIPAGYSFAIYWGFLVYAVAVPAALMILWLAIRFDRKPTLKNGLGVAAWSIATYFCHVVALGFGSLIALAYLLGRHWRTPQTLILRAIPYTAPVPLIALWMRRVYGTEASVEGSPIIFAPLRDRMSILFNQLSGLDGSSFILGFSIAAAVLMLPFLGGYKLSRRPERWLPLVIGVAVFMVFPHYMQSTAYLFQRLAVFLVPLWLIVWEAPVRTRAFLPFAVMVVFGCWVGSTIDRFARFAQESEDFSAVLAEAEPGRRMAGMLFCNGSDHFVYPVYLHYHAWYQATAGGISDNSFALTHPSMVRYRDMAAPRVGDYLAWRPAALDWLRDGGDSYDYFLVCAGGDASQLIFKEHVDLVRLVVRKGPWWLYERQQVSSHD